MQLQNFKHLTILAVPKSEAISEIVDVGTPFSLKTLKEFEEICKGTSGNRYWSGRFVLAVRNLMYFARRIGIGNAIDVNLKLIDRPTLTSMMEVEIGANRRKTYQYISDYNVVLHGRMRDTRLLKGNIIPVPTAMGNIWDRNVVNTYWSDNNMSRNLLQAYTMGGQLVKNEALRITPYHMTQIEYGASIPKPIHLNEIESNNVLTTMMSENPIFNIETSIRNKFYKTGEISDSNLPIIKSKTGDISSIYKENTCNDPYAFNYRPKSFSEKDCVYLGCENSNDCPNDTHMCVYNYCTNVVKKSDISVLTIEDMNKILSTIDVGSFPKHLLKKVKQLERNDISRSKSIVIFKQIINAVGYKSNISVTSGKNRFSIDKDYYMNIMSKDYNFTPISEIKSKSIKARGKNVDEIEWFEKHPSIANKSILKKNIIKKIEKKK